MSQQPISPHYLLPASGIRLNCFMDLLGDHHSGKDAYVAHLICCPLKSL